MIKATNGVSKALKCWFYPNVVSTASGARMYSRSSYNTDNTSISNYFYADISNGEVTGVRDLVWDIYKEYDGATLAITDGPGGYDLVGTIYKVE